MNALTELWTEHAPLARFEPTAKYIPAMDCLIYLREDCSYRAVRLNTFQTILLHPHEDRPVGVKLKGMRFLHHRLHAILRAAKGGEVDMRSIGLVALWETALTASGDSEVEDAEKERQKLLARRAREEIVNCAPAVDVDEFALAA